MTLDKNVDFKAIEKKYTAAWDDAGVFRCDPASKKDGYCIMMPPPNVTGSLHIGHALTFTLQDVLVRFHRMAENADVLWQPGTDHAGIATQMVVERQLAEQGVDRHMLGREKFLEKVWQWKEQSGGTIVRQLHRLGASPDWTRERFTMDDGLAAAVRKAFVQMYRDKLIYKDQRLVNWDPKLETAISDLEVENREIKGTMWYIRYPVTGTKGDFITVATTRPETMLGDTAVAVNPKDKRFKKLVGKTVMLPIANREIPIIADDAMDMDKGSGAVKITPAHDFNDFETGRRHDLPMINIFTPTAHLNQNVPADYQGLERFEARRKILAELTDLGLLEKEEPNQMMQPYGDRSGVVIEPFLTEQWYCDAATLAKPALEAVKTGKTRFVPKNWEKTYFHWLNNIQPWCISRQLWWGHQIPAWYAPDGTVFVAESADEAAAQAAAHYGKAVTLTQDEDVLDTWFSSGLWPFSTLDWPQDNAALRKYYPNTVLVTGFDIIFFWVARMMMMGLYFMKDVPFRDVYIHALVRDAKGQKMSKSKGNIIDPLDVIDEFGADAMRFTLTILAAQGRDVRLDLARVEGYRNFATKIWNAARYLEMRGCHVDPAFRPDAVGEPLNQWIASEVARVAAEVRTAMAEYRFDGAAQTLYHFVWGTFCDWYLEFTKPVMEHGAATAQAETKACAAWVFDQILLMLHPMMPFITEELWQKLAPREGFLTATKWPEYPKKLIQKDSAKDIEWVIDLISKIRNIRAEMNVPAAAKINALLKDLDPARANILKRFESQILMMARLNTIASHSGSVPKGAAQMPLTGGVLILPLADVIDLDKERNRLNNEISKLRGEIEKIDSRLSNADFVKKAPESVVEEQQSRKSHMEEFIHKLDAALKMLSA